MTDDLEIRRTLNSVRALLVAVIFGALALVLAFDEALWPAAICAAVAVVGVAIFALLRQRRGVPL
jgi:hypothetical protein